jgi:biopolymer transport protein ExbB/TolQ
MTERLLKVALLGSAWVLYLLLFLSVVSISVIVERWLYFRKIADDLGPLRKSVLESLLRHDYAAAESRLAKSPSIEARVIAVGLTFRQGGPEAVAEAVDGELDRRRADLERGTNLLGTLGNNAPFVGLFGTVLGVIEAFHHLGDGHDDAAMGSVMAAIAEALVATGVGLFVAIPAVVAYNVIQQRIGEVETRVSGFRKLLLASLRVAGASGASPGTAAVEASEEPSEPVHTPRGAGLAQLSAEV